jgi:hypothetical protein
MKNWEKFELECTEYLNSSFGEYAKFTQEGGSNSTVSDIFVETADGNFYIDVKHSPAQCGQFVLLPDKISHTFKYSEKNNHKINNASQQIIEHMNNHFDDFKNAGTAGKEIVMEDDQNIFSDWIIQTYKEKGTEFFITNNNTIIPLEQFQKYFNVTATYRVKRSGSSHPNPNSINNITEHLISFYNIRSEDIEFTDDGHLLVTSASNLNNVRFQLEDYEYMFSRRDDNYEIRRLSNTYNANVIFSIKLKEGVIGISSNEFISALKLIHHKT